MKYNFVIVCTIAFTVSALMATPRVVTPKNAKILFSELLPHELMQRIKEKPVAVLPIGAIEYHGPQCCGHVDVNQAEVPSWKAVEKHGGVCINTMYWGGRAGHALFPSSLLVRTSVVRDLLIDIIENLRRHGFRAVVGVTGHMAPGHVKALKAVNKKYENDPHMEIHIHPMGKLIKKYKLEKKYNIERGAWDHGGANETSNIMASAPHRADLSQLPKKGSELPFVAIEGIDPHLATPEYGKRVLEAAGEAVGLEMEAMLKKALAKPLPKREAASLKIVIEKAHMKKRVFKNNKKNFLLLTHHGVERKIELVKNQYTYEIDHVWAGKWGIYFWGFSEIKGHLHGRSAWYEEKILNPGSNTVNY